MEPSANLEGLRTRYPDKIASEGTVFRHIRRGARIFVGTGCGEPQYLIDSLIHFVQAHPKAFYDAEVLHLWTLGVAPYTDEKFTRNFRHNSFFVGNSTRDAVNKGLADYTPIFLSQVPNLFTRGLVTVDVALIQVSPPDEHGYMSLGVSVDITKAAIEHASVVIAQVNAYMPRVHGDGFVHIDEVDFILPRDEPILELRRTPPDETAQQIGRYVASLIRDGDTVQVGYGRIPDAIMSCLDGKNHIGVHTELLSDGLVELLRQGVVDNTGKTINRGKSVAAFCMGSKATYAYIHDNPSIQFRTIEYTNSTLIIAQHRNMVAINSALEIDLTGQSTAESLGKLFYSGIGGQADFMRGAIIAPNGKSILALQSTSDDGESSRIVPFLKEGAGVTLVRGDIHYVVTEYGIAYLHGKNIRERAMQLISIAHPKFQPWLIEEARRLNLIYRDQAYIQGKGGEYPEDLVTYRTTRTGLEVMLRPVKISDEPLLKDFFYSLSDTSLYRRFMSARKDMPHERLQPLVVVDYTREMAILAVRPKDRAEEVIGLAHYYIDDASHTAELAVVVADAFQEKGVGTELVSYTIYLAKHQGLLGLTAEVLADNRAMLKILERAGFQAQDGSQTGTYTVKLVFQRETGEGPGERGRSPGF